MKKKLVLICLVATCIVLGVFCYKAWLVSFVVAKFLSGRKEGRQGIVRSVVIPWRSYQLHLHHWLLALIVCGVFLARGTYFFSPEVSYGVLSAAIFQGIYCYKDWHRVVIRKTQAAGAEALTAVGYALTAPAVEGSHLPAPGTESAPECCAQATY